MVEINSTLFTMKDIKREGECCFCLSKEDLFSLLEPYNFEEKVEIYSTMIAACFQIELSSYIEECNRNLYLICRKCVFRLRDAITFRSQIQIAYNRLQTVFYIKEEPGVVSNENPDVMETKDHIIKSEYVSMNVDTEASSSNENVSKLKPLKVALQKIDNNTMENVSIVSSETGSIEKSHPLKIFVCNVCNKIFENLNAIEQHKTVHSNTKDHILTNKNTCRYCNKAFHDNRNLLEHEKIHLGIKDLICDHCERGFRQKCNLKKHILLHMGVKKVKCDLCNKCFVSRSNLSNHKRTSHSVTFYCNICGKTLKCKRSFDKHVLSHSNVKNEKCDVCEKSFTRKDALSRHKKIHFNLNKTTCKYCNKEFSTKYTLLEHEKIHSDIKDFICAYCQRGFRNKAKLKEHILAHMGMKNIKCDLCHRCFVSKSLLATHKRAFHSIRL